jgi:hypothetical protein
MRKTTLLALAALLCGAPARAADASDPPPDVTCRLDSGRGKVTATGGPRGLVVSVDGRVYQGAATLAFRSTPPRRLTFRLANLNSMPTFSVTDRKRTFRASFVFSNGKARAYFDQAGRPVSAAQAAVTITAEAAKGNEMRVTVHAHGVELGRDIEAQWSLYGVKDKVVRGFQDS